MQATPEALVNPVLMRRFGNTLIIYAIISIIAALVGILGLITSTFLGSMASTSGVPRSLQWASSAVSVTLNVLMIVALFRCQSSCSRYAAQPGEMEMAGALHHLDRYYLLILVAIAFSIVNAAVTVILIRF